MKICIRCKTNKATTDYYVHAQMADGRLNVCKSCVKSRVKKRYYKKHDEIITYEKSRARLPHRIEARKIYSRSAHGKEIANISRLNWTKENKEKIRLSHKR